MPDHVHLTAGLPADMSLSKALQLLKGGSAKLFLRSIPKQDLGIQEDIFGAEEDFLLHLDLFKSKWQTGMSLSRREIMNLPKARRNL